MRHAFRFASSILLTGAVAALSAHPASAQSFPTRPISFVVPYGPGTGNDLIARVISQQVGDGMGRPMVIENKPGAAGAIGVDLAARAPADGHTIVITGTSQLINPYIVKVNYDLLHQFVAVIQPAAAGYVLAVPNTSPARSLKDLVALAKAEPGKFNYGGTYASVSHFLGELLKSAGQIDISLVSYKSTSDATADVIANRIGLLFTTTATGIPLAKAGKVRLLAACRPERLAAMPEVPTVAEAGFPTLDVPSRFFVLAPAQTPSAVVAILNQHIAKALATPEVKDKLALQGVDAKVNTPQEAATILKDSIGEWGRIVRQAGVKMQ